MKRTVIVESFENEHLNLVQMMMTIVASTCVEFDTCIQLEMV